MANETPNVLRTSAWLMVSRTFPTLALLAVNMWYARKLDFYDYASYQSAWLWANALTLLGTIGLPKYLLTFGGGHQLFAKHKKRKLFSIGFIIVLTGYLLSPFFSVFSWIEMLLFLSVILMQAAVLIYESILLHARRNRRIMFSSFVFSGCLLAGHYIIEQWGFNLTSWLGMMLVVGTIRAVMMYSPRTGDSNDAEKPAELKWIAANDALQFVTKWLDKIILVYLLTPKEYSIYFNGTNEIPLTGVLIAAFGAAFSVHTVKSNSKAAQILVFRQSATAFSAILFPLFGLCLFFPEEIVTTLFGQPYASSAKLFALMAFMIPLRIAVYTPMLQQQGKGKTIIAGAFLDLLIATVLMLLLYPVASVMGIAIAVVAATYGQVVYYIYHITKAYNASLFDLFNGRLLGVRLFTVIAAFALLRCMLWENVDLVSVISSALLCIITAAYYLFIEWRKSASRKSAH
jgi:O-antigen/teichoic acid export membrane protein